MKLKTQLDVVKYKNFSVRWRPGGAGPPSVHLGPSDISIQHEGSCHIDFWHFPLPPVSDVGLEEIKTVSVLQYCVLL